MTKVVVETAPGEVPLQTDVVSKGGKDWRYFYLPCGSTLALPEEQWDKPDRTTKYLQRAAAHHNQNVHSPVCDQENAWSPVKADSMFGDEIDGPWVTIDLPLPRARELRDMLRHVPGGSGAIGDEIRDQIADQVEKRGLQ